MNGATESEAPNAAAMSTAMSVENDRDVPAPLIARSARALVSL